MKIDEKMNKDNNCRISSGHMIPMFADSQDVAFLSAELGTAQSQRVFIILSITSLYP